MEQRPATETTTERPAEQKQLHRTSGSEREHRDNNWTASTKVAPRDHRGEIPD